MFGVPIEGPANVHCNNQRVVQNTSPLEPTLSQRHNAINCHAVHEACAAGITRVAEEPTKTDLADPFMKPLSRLLQEQLLACIVWGSFAHKEWSVRQKRKHPKDGAASQVSFPIEGAGTSWVGDWHQGHQTLTQVLVVL